MAKVKKLQWLGSADDITCRTGGYILRVEQMDDQLWWWAVIYQATVVDENFASTKCRAKTLAEDVFYNVSDSNK